MLIGIMIGFRIPTGTLMLNAYLSHVPNSPATPPPSLLHLPYYQDTFTSPPAGTVVSISQLDFYGDDGDPKTYTYVSVIELGAGTSLDLMSPFTDDSNKADLCVKDASRNWRVVGTDEGQPLLFKEPLANVGTQMKQRRKKLRGSEDDVPANNAEANHYDIDSEFAAAPFHEMSSEGKNITFLKPKSSDKRIFLICLVKSSEANPRHILENAFVIINNCIDFSIYTRKEKLH